MEEIARRSGISVPVLYDHFASKQELHRRLLERHYGDLRSIWHQYLGGDEPAEQRIARTLDAWFGYVESHPYAWRMLFQDTTGQDAAETVRRTVAEESRALILPLFDRERSAAEAGTGDWDNDDLELAWQAWSGAVQALALWWREHQHVSRRKIVAAAMDTLWIGLERTRASQRWMDGADGSRSSAAAARPAGPR